MAEGVEATSIELWAVAGDTTAAVGRIGLFLAFFRHERFGFGFIDRDDLVDDALATHRQRLLDHAQDVLFAKLADGRRGAEPAGGF